MSDEKQEGRQSDFNVNTINIVLFLIEEDQCETVDEIERYFNTLGTADWRQYRFLYGVMELALKIRKCVRALNTTGVR